MMDIWLFLLVLVAIIIGWLLGRWQPLKKKAGNKQSDQFSERYAKQNDRDYSAFTADIDSGKLEAAEL